MWEKDHKDEKKKKILRREESGLQSELYQSEAQSGERGRRWSISWRWRRACRLVLHVWGDRRRKHHCPASHHQPTENTYRQGQDVTFTPTDSLTVLWIYQVAKVSALEVICHIHFGSILVFSDDLFTKLLSFSEFLNCQVNCINKALPPNILTVNRKTWASCWMSVI